MGRLYRWWLMAVVSLLWEADAGAVTLGLKTSPGELRVEDVGVGRTYNLRSLRGASYALLNEGDSPVEVETTALSVEAKSLKPGYEAIPDPGWIRVIPSKSTLPVGGGSRRDIILSVPDDPRWAGRRFQGVIMSSTRGTGMMSAAVQTRLLFSTNSSSGGVKGSIPIPEFELDPALVTLSGFPVAKKVKVETHHGRRIQVVNRSKINLKIGLERVPFGTIKLPEGYEELPAAAKARLLAKTIKLAPEEALDWGLELSLPAESHGKRYAILIKAAIKDQPLALEEYLIVLVDAEIAKEETR